VSTKISNIPVEQRLKLARVAARWRVPSWYAEKLLKDAGILIDIEVPPVKGVRLEDLLRFEDAQRKVTKLEVVQ
jgi:hypothetical protein